MEKARRKRLVWRTIIEIIASNQKVPEPIVIRFRRELMLRSR